MPFWPSSKRRFTKRLAGAALALGLAGAVLTWQPARAQQTAGGGGGTPGGRFTGGVVTRPIKAPDGSCAAPAYTFGNFNLGFYLESTHAIGFCVNGLVMWYTDGTYFKLANAYLNLNGSYIADQTQGVFLNPSVVTVAAGSGTTTCGTSPAVPVGSGITFQETVGTGGTATGCLFNFGNPASAHGWNCPVVNITATAAHRADKRTVQTASTTQSVTVEYQTVSTGAAAALTAGDVLQVGPCGGF